MAGERLGARIGMKEDIIKKACSVAMKAHKSSLDKLFVEESIGSSDVIFGFPGSWSLRDWFYQMPFGTTNIKVSVFPSIKSIGVDEVAIVNEAFMLRFESVLKNSPLESRVQKALNDRRQIVFTGHSIGGSVAVLATIWYLEKFVKQEKGKSPRCLTFGCPLIGNHILSHALKRENWSSFFIHFVMKYDIVPRILLAPLSSIQPEFRSILDLFKSKAVEQEYNYNVMNNNGILMFYKAVMRNASSITSHVACNLMGSTNLLLQTLTSFTELSPYRPFGTYVICIGNGKLITLNNPDAVLQLLFYSCQLVSESEGQEIAFRSLSDHFAYRNELQDCLEMQDVVYLDREGELGDEGAKFVDEVMKEIGVSSRGKMCFLAALEAEKQKIRNQDKIEKKKPEIEKCLNVLESYREMCEVQKIGYYDAFKFQKNQQDFLANVKRLELAGIWDEIVEMLKKYELPDQFEGRKEWIEVGTRYRRLVEPLDVANYYRHLKNEDTGPYLDKGRPRRYRISQNWREHVERMQAGFSGESCFWAEVEELSTQPFNEFIGRAEQLQAQVDLWNSRNELGKDVFLEESSFVKWWKSLPPQHSSSKIKAIINI